MSVPVIVSSNISIQDTRIKFFLEDVGSTYITEKHCLVGLVSRENLLKSVMGKMNIEEIPVSMVMIRVPNVVYILNDDSGEFATKNY